MKGETKILLKKTLLVVSIVVTVIAFLRSVSDDAGAGILVVLLWGIGPYLLFWLATYFLERFSSMPQVPGIGFGLSIPILIYALAVYLEPLNHKSSTEGLIFIFAPLWLYIFTLPALGLCILVARLLSRDVEQDS